MTWAARLGYTETQFWETTPRFFYNAMVGKIIDNREVWERERAGWWIRYQLTPQKGKHKGMLEWFPFPWEADKLEKHKETDKAQMIERLKSGWDRWMKELEQKNGERS